MDFIIHDAIDYEWNISELNGYIPFTNVWSILAGAEMPNSESGLKRVVDKLYEAWHDSYKEFTEFVLALNHRCWLHYDLGNNEASKFYSDAYYHMNDYALEHFKGDELTYYIRTLD